MLGELTRLLDEAVSAGELRKTNTRLLARAIQAVIAGALLQWAIDRDGTVIERLREDLDTVLRPRITGARRRPHRLRRQTRRS
jgi:hypothetical protein